MKRKYLNAALAAALAGTLLLPGLALAEDGGVSQGLFTANNVWMMLCAGLVFIMHLGFATLESGLTRAKHTSPSRFASRRSSEPPARACRAA